MVIKALVGLILGVVVGFAVGIVIFRLTADPADGWADLTSIAGSLFTYAPVGGLIGLALGVRRRPWPWARMIVAGVVIGAIPVVFIRDAPIIAWGFASAGLLIGGFAAWWVDRRGANHTQPV